MKRKLTLVFGITMLVFLVILVSSNSIINFRRSLKHEEEKANLMAHFVIQDLRLHMREKRTDIIGDIIATYGAAKQIRHIAITDLEGELKFYSEEDSELKKNRKINIMRERALKENKTFVELEQTKNDPNYTVFVPIQNEKACFKCHGQDKKILGVLTVNFDWTEQRKNLLADLRRNILYALVFYILVLVFFFIFQRLYNTAQESYRNLKHTQEQLIKAEKMAAVGQMAAAISHDLRNPLTGIKMATYYLSGKIDKSDKDINNILKDIELEINYASNVVTNILLYSRPTELIYTRSDINKIIEDTLHFVRLQNRDERIEIVTDYAQDIAEILIDTKQMKQAIINLLANAIQSMPNDGTLTVITRRKESQIEIMIEDTGVGIAQDKLDKVMSPFFTTKAKGVGLGLSIVNNIIKKHGGEMEILSQLNKGTRVIVRLPLRFGTIKGEGEKK